MESFLVDLFLYFYYAISELEQNKQNNTIIFFFTIYFFNKKVDLSSLRGGAGAPIAPPLPTGLVLQHGGSILRFVILCGTFRRISQLWNNAHSLNLENCLLYLSSTISQFFDFVRRIVLDFIFYCVTVHTLYSVWERDYPSICSYRVTVELERHEQYLRNRKHVTCRR